MSHSSALLDVALTFTLAHDLKIGLQGPYRGSCARVQTYNHHTCAKTSHPLELLSMSFLSPQDTPPNII